MQTDLDIALEGVVQAAKNARQAQTAAEHEAADFRAHALEWEQKYQKERQRVSELKAQLEKAKTQSCHPALPPRQPSGRFSRLAMRRNTVPPRIQREWVEASTQSQQMEPPQALSRERSESSLSSFTLSSLSSTLAACVLLQGATQSPSLHPHHQHLDGHHHEHDHSTVSVADDGQSGVGAAAAAAVSVALAQSWAAVARGGKSSALPDAAAAAIHPGKARFKLVAAVPRSRRGPVPGSNNNNAPSASASPASERNGTTSAIVAKSPGSFQGDSSLVLESIDDAQELDDRQEATWRASGSHLKLHWMTAPSTVLVVHKPTVEVVEATAIAVAWLVQRGVVVYVEPDSYETIKRATHAVLSLICTAKEARSINQELDFIDLPDRRDTTGSTIFGPDEVLTPACEAQAEAEEAAREARASIAENAEDLLNRLLLTFKHTRSTDNGCECSNSMPLIPVEVAHRLDLVVTLGGDGTVLWACSLFGNGSVPPVVPVAMGSLGFMTPFPLARMDSVLARVTSVAHGFPLMLRHRLQCRILRAGTSGADLSSLTGPPCSEDVLVLNEVVIDRGMTASLANLQCYVDRNFVTTILGDGLIVSTPTGSTAYNLAAGGSMVHPAVPCILFTPICAHTLSSRPLVFPEHVTLRVKVPSDSRYEAYCSFDGRGRQVLHPGDSVLIHVSQWPVPMVCNLDSSHDWFLSVREGLNWNQRVPQKSK